MAISGVCKVEFATYVKSKVSEGLPKKDIIETFAKDADISEDTVKHWMYPESQKKAEKKYQKGRKNAETSTRQNPDTERFSADLAGFTDWNKSMSLCLKFASDIIKNKTTWKTDKEKAVVVKCFRLVDKFYDVHIKKSEGKKVCLGNIKRK
jgi:hypothetical protein